MCVALSPYKPHLRLARTYWDNLASPGDQVLDATAGNGEDSLYLSQLVLKEDQGSLFVLDIQSQALNNTEALLRKNLSDSLMKRVHFFQQCHSRFPDSIPLKSLQLIVYNLGYLPKGDKTITTQTNTTLQSIQHAEEWIKEGGAISITCYPGHNEGEREEKALLEYISSLSHTQWNCCLHRWINRPRSPVLILLQKRNGLNSKTQDT